MYEHNITHITISAEDMSGQYSGLSYPTDSDFTSETLKTNFNLEDVQFRYLETVNGSVTFNVLNLV